MRERRVLRWWTWLQAASKERLGVRVRRKEERVIGRPQPARFHRGLDSASKRRACDGGGLWVLDSRVVDSSRHGSMTLPSEVVR